MRNPLPPPPTHTDNAIEQFTEAIVAENNASYNTCMAYIRDLNDFNTWLKKRKITLGAAQKSNIEAYLVDCDQRHLAPATKVRRLSSIRQFYRFAFHEGWRTDNPAQKIKNGTIIKSLPYVLNNNDVDKLLATARHFGRTPLLQARNYCLIEMLYATGMRVSELVSLTMNAIQGQPDMILVRGKGNKERLVPMSAPAQKALSDWLIRRNVKRNPEYENKNKTKPFTSSYLFPSRGKSGHLTRIHFYGLIKDIALAAGLDPQKITPHSVRHAFATHLLANGANLIAIQKMLGHASVSSTEIYTHVLEDHLQRLLLEHHPLAGVNTLDS